MQLLTREAFDLMREGAAVLEQDAHGEKVLALEDGTFLKLFRRKTWFSKTAFISPAARFARNSEHLAERDIPSPKVIGLFRLTSPYRSVVHYHPLPGRTLRELARTGDSPEMSESLLQLAGFVRSLHESGVYFRSLHFGNIVFTPDGRLGLIDISDMRCSPSPLSRRMRARNLKHLMRYEADWKLLPSELGNLIIRELLEL